MITCSRHHFIVPPELAGLTLGAALRRLAGPLSWNDARRLVTNRHVQVNGSLALNDARRLSAGETIEVFEEPRRPVPREHNIRLLHIDSDLLVLDKPPGLVTLRRDEERDLSQDRKDLHPTLDELVPRLLPGHTPPQGRRRSRPRSQISNLKSPHHPLHRLDRDTSGLMLFALSPRARDALIAQFSRHEVQRTYFAAAHGHISAPRSFESYLVRNRGDGLRGSSPRGPEDPDAQRALTHVIPAEHIASSFTVLKVRLETGRTHQIRIHLAEAGHMICGEKLYTRPRPGAEPLTDASGAPRQALHSADLRLTHPFTNRPMEFSSPLPKDLAAWLERLRSGPTRT